MVNHSFVKAVGGLDGWATIQSDGTSLRVKTDKVQVTVVLSEGNIPAYERFYNEEKNYTLEVGRAELLAAVEDIFVYNSVDTAPHIAKLMFPKNAVSVNYHQAETNKDYETSVYAKHKLDIEKMYFIASKLKNVLSMFPSTTDTIKIAVEASNKIIFVKSDEDPLLLGLNPLAY